MQRESFLIAWLHFFRYQLMGLVIDDWKTFAEWKRREDLAREIGAFWPRKNCDRSRR